MSVHLLLVIAAIVLVVLDIVLPRSQYMLHAAVLCLALSLIV